MNTNIKDVISIKYGDWAALVCARLGGNVIVLQHKGQDVLVPLVDEAQLKVNPYLQGSPILFPANRTNFAKFTFEGKGYTLPLNEDWSQCHSHGFVHPPLHARRAEGKRGNSQARLRPDRRVVPLYVRGLGDLHA